MKTKTIYFYIENIDTFENYLIAIKQQKNIQKLLKIFIYELYNYNEFKEDIEETNEYLDPNENIINPSLNDTDNFIYRYIYNHNSGNLTTEENKKRIKILLRKNIFKIRITYKS